MLFKKNCTLLGSLGRVLPYECTTAAIVICWKRIS